MPDVTPDRSGHQRHGEHWIWWEHRAIHTPTLLMAGSQDRAIPIWQQRKILDILPDVRFELVEGSGHVVYLEQREHFFSRLRTFLLDNPATRRRPTGGSESPR